MSYLKLPIETNPDAIEEALYDLYSTAFPGWEPTAGDPLVWIAKWGAAQVTDLASLASDVSGEVFHDFGRLVVGLSPIEAAPALAEATFVAVDDAGYTIPAGTQIEVATSGDEAVGFETVADATINPGSTTVTGVELRALVDGSEANGVTGVATSVDSFYWIDSITLTTTSSGGVDAENPDTYRNRLAAEVQVLTAVPVLPRDVEVLSRRVAGVGRATALDGYNPADSTFDNERMVTVAVVDAAGEALGTPTKDEVDALLQARREINFVFNVIDPTYNTVKVDVDAVSMPGYDPAAVDAAIVAALNAYLSPANWGGPISLDQDPATWRNKTTVRRFDLIALVDNVPGVDYVTGLTLALEADVLGSANVTLTGAAPLPRPGTITVDVT